jgi:ABC-2 type transport system ATP-binding protein
MPDEVGFYEELTARDNLAFIARLNGLSSSDARQRIDTSLARVGLSGAADQRVSTFSRGMRRRLGVADVLIKEPKLVIMDEPTQGLDPEGARSFLHTIRSLKEEGITVDPEGARSFLHTIRSLKEEGITVLLSSHLLHQVQAVCDRVGLFRRGRMELVGSVTDLAQEVLGSGFRIRLQAQGDVPRLTQSLQALPHVVSVQQDAGDRYLVDATRDVRAEAADTVIGAGGRLLELDIQEPGLDDIYTGYFEEVNHDGTD